MFALQIHSVEFPQPLSGTTSAACVSNSPINFASLNPVEQRGVAHLFRHLPPSASATYATALTGIANPTARTTALFVVSVPSSLSAADFLIFCGSHVEQFTGVLFLRNDVMEDRFSVLITLVNQLAADGFYCNYNGRRFKHAEHEVCHIYFTQSVECTESVEIASTLPLGYTELPTCPVCLERLDQETSGIQSTFCDHSFQYSCVSKWIYSSGQWLSNPLKVIRRTFHFGNDVSEHENLNNCPPLFKVTINWPHVVEGAPVDKLEPRFYIHRIWSIERVRSPNPNSAYFNSLLEQFKLNQMFVDYEKEILHYWSDVRDPERAESTLEFFKYQWSKHGFPLGFSAPEYLWYGLAPEYLWYGLALRRAIPDGTFFLTICMDLFE